MTEDSLFNQIANIAKSGAYDIVSKQVQELQKENEGLKQKNEQLFIALNYLLSSYSADFENITRAKLNYTEAVKVAKASIEANNIK